LCFTSKDEVVGARLTISKEGIKITTEEDKRLLLEK
jgi:hypothetical protein